MTQKRHEKSALVTRWLRASLVPLLLISFVSPALRADELPSLDNSDTKIYYQNATHFRGKDATGDRVGLSKFRNTLQVEHKRSLGDGWDFKGIFRGTFDGVYSLNDDEFGKNAGGPVNATENSGASFILSGGAIPGSTPGSVPYGSSVVQLAPGSVLVGGVPVAPFFPATVTGGPLYAYNSASNPNQGLMHVGQRWNNAWSNPIGPGELDFITAVRPCDKDNRGCADFGGYGALTTNGLQAPEFNKRWDFIREFYAQKNWDLADGKQFNVKVGKQQVVWGRSDLFRVLDVINPMDYSRNSIYDEFEDIRIPMWMVQGNYRMGPSDALSERNIQVVWNFDQFRPNNLGQCGTPNAVLEAHCFFRANKMVWDYGGTIGNLAPAAGLGLPTPPLNPLGGVAVTLPAHLAGIRDVYLPEWRLKNTQLGSRFEGVSKDGTIAFSVNGLIGRSQMPSLHAFRPSALAFDVVYPRISVIGGSMDFNAEAINTTVRLEGAVSHGEEFVNTMRSAMYSRHRVWRSVVGLDRPTNIDWLNKDRTTLISAQLFWQHIFNFEEGSNQGFDQGVPGSIKEGTVGYRDNNLITLLISTQYMQDRLTPKFVVARDLQARANVFIPSVTYLYSDKLKFVVGGNFKTVSNQSRWTMADGRTTSGTVSPVGQPLDGLIVDSGGLGPSLGGLEALGRFRAGLIGTALKEDEIFFNMQYQF